LHGVPIEKTHVRVNLSHINNGERGVRVTVFNATFNNILDILWRSVLFVEETGISGTMLVVIGTDCIGSLKSN